jgi:hypothetical protein
MFGVIEAFVNKPMHRMEEIIIVLKVLLLYLTNIRQNFALLIYLWSSSFPKMDEYYKRKSIIAGKITFLTS